MRSRSTSKPNVTAKVGVGHYKKDTPIVFFGANKFHARPRIISSLLLFFLLIIFKTDQTQHHLHTTTHSLHRSSAIPTTTLPFDHRPGKLYSLLLCIAM